MKLPDGRPPSTVARNLLGVSPSFRWISLPLHTPAETSQGYFPRAGRGIRDKKAAQDLLPNSPRLLGAPTLQGQPVGWLLPHVLSHSPCLGGTARGQMGPAEGRRGRWTGLIAVPGGHQRKNKYLLWILDIFLAPK